ncbi:hypothetical protein EC988_007628, partial [Linderina pennispora]
MSRAKNMSRRRSSIMDVNPGDDFSPLSETFKPSSTRAHFEELVSQYRKSDSSIGKAQGRLDTVANKKDYVLGFLNDI